MNQQELAIATQLEAIIKQLGWDKFEEKLLTFDFILNVVDDDKRIYTRPGVSITITKSSRRNKSPSPIRQIDNLDYYKTALLTRTELK